MNNKDFILWIKSLGFEKFWNSLDEYSIRDMNTTNISKVYFIVDSCYANLYYTGFTNQFSFGSNLLKFRLDELSDNNKRIVISTIIRSISKHFSCYDTSILISALRDLKLKNILKD